MSSLDGLNLLRELQRENVWWSDGNVPPELARDFKRADFFVYKKQMFEQDYANIIIGPRRVGKSTTLYQLIDHLIKEKNVPPRRIMLLSLERAFFNVVNNPVKESLGVFEENVLKEALSSLKEPIYVFLDEASRRNSWALEVKEYIDRKYKIKFFITGSSSPALFQKSSESLVGRHEKRIMLTLKFRDTLKLKNLPELNACLDRVNRKELRNAFITSIKQENPEIFSKALTDAYLAYGPTGESLMQIHLNEYFLRGGFPEFYDKNMNWQQTSKMLREGYFDAIISFDVMRIFNSRNPDKLKQLYTYLALSTAQTVNLTNLGSDLGISRVTLDEYIYQLQQTYLIRSAKTYKKNIRRASNDIKKVYVGDVGFRNAVLGLGEEEIKEPVLLGNIAETVAQDHTCRLKYCLEPAEKCELFFWKDKQNKEVDIIAEFGKKTIPIEVKYQESIRGEDIKALKNAIEQLESPYGILLTKNSLQCKDGIVSVPMWLWLLMC
jgi:predicted AAA+ superfamily ATPase